MILITGAAQGLGRAIALELSARKKKVVIHYRQSKEKAEEVSRLCNNAPLIQGDFSTPESTKDFSQRYLEEFPETKGLVNNVGNYFEGNVSQTTEEQWLDIFQTNLHAPFILTKTLLPSLKKFQGKIVNIGIAGVKSLRANTYATAYTATKSALNFLTLSLAKELASELVTVNMVSPGYLEVSQDLPEQFPMKRPATLQEAAKLVAFFFEKEAEYITGQNVEIGGGVAL